jgi:hypothetical protein
MRRYSGSIKSLLQRRAILLGGSEQHSDAVEGHTFSSERSHPTRNFDAFAALARRRENQHLIRICRLGRARPLIKQMLLKAR